LHNEYREKVGFAGMKLEHLLEKEVKVLQKRIKSFNN